MKKIILCLTLGFLIISCSDDNSNSDSTQLFRNIFNNTSWSDSDGVVYTFKTGKLFYWGIIQVLCIIQLVHTTT